MTSNRLHLKTSQTPFKQVNKVGVVGVVLVDGVDGVVGLVELVGLVWRKKLNVPPKKKREKTTYVKLDQPCW